MPFTAAILILATQGIPARAVVLDATFKDKPYGKVTYVRGLVPGKGMERIVTMEVDDESGKYTIQERRSYAHDGAPTSTVRTFSDGVSSIIVTLTYSGLKAIVTHQTGDGEPETEEFPLEVEAEGAKVNDPSQFWFFGKIPARNTKVVFWEYSLDKNNWVEKTVTYTGIAELKLGEKTVQAHRINISKDTNFYVDDNGMPYKSSQETGAGTLTLVRREGVD
jgi:hypothetical protein